MTILPELSELGVNHVPKAFAFIPPEYWGLAYLILLGTFIAVFAISVWIWLSGK